MVLRRITVVLVALTLLAPAAFASACEDGSTATDTIYEQTATGAIYEQTATGAIYGESTTTSVRTTTTHKPLGASVVFAKVGEVMDVDQGELSVDKVTVTDDLASDAANALLLTGEKGEGKNASKKPAAGNEFLMITFKYKKAPWYDFRGGIFSDEIVLKNAKGTTYPLIETKGYGGIAESNAGSVKPGVEAYTTAVFEVPKGETGLVLIYHEKGKDGFTCNIR
jgi:hypothetical protein